MQWRDTRVIETAVHKRKDKFAPHHSVFSFMLKLLSRPLSLITTSDFRGMGQWKGCLKGHCDSGNRQPVADRRIRFQESKQLLGVAWQISVIIFPFKKFLGWKCVILFLKLSLWLQAWRPFNWGAFFWIDSALTSTFIQLESSESLTSAFILLSLDHRKVQQY